MGLAIHAGAGVMGADVLWRPGWLLRWVVSSLAPPARACPHFSSFCFCGWLAKELVLWPPTFRLPTSCSLGVLCLPVHPRCATSVDVFHFVSHIGIFWIYFTF